MATVVSFPQAGEIKKVAQERLSVRRIREILRLQAEGFSERQIARSVGCARSSVQICLWRAERAGVGWPLPAELDDAALDARLYRQQRPVGVAQPIPDFEWIARAGAARSNSQSAWQAPLRAGLWRRKSRYVVGARARCRIF